MRTVTYIHQIYDAFATLYVIYHIADMIYQICHLRASARKPYSHNDEYVLSNNTPSSTVDEQNKMPHQDSASIIQVSQKRSSICVVFILD